MRRLLFVLLLVTACRNADKFRSPLTLGGQEISASVLNQGHALYAQHCASCHGEMGAGDGPQAKGMEPPPPDLRRGLVKFASVDAGALPTDQDLIRTVRKGLAGTAMTPSTLSTDEITAIVHYIKTFSPRWQTDAAGAVAKPDPEYANSDRRLKLRSQEDWIELGRRNYHIEAKCWSCHPAYETKEDLYEVSNRTITSFRADLYEPKPWINAFGARVLSPDFTTTALKTGNSEEALYRVISAGIGGSGMGPLRYKLDQESIWSIVYYVRSLTELKDTEKSKELRSRLEAQIDWHPGQ